MNCNFIERVTSHDFVIEVVEHAVCLSQEVYCDTAGDCIQEAFEDLIDFELDCLLYNI